MSEVKIDIDKALAAPLHQTNQPVQEAARQTIVLELYRRGSVSSGNHRRQLILRRTTRGISGKPKCSR
jgi:hypothetical protein